MVDFRKSEGKSADYSVQSIARRAMQSRDEDGLTESDEWGNAAATFRHAARNIDEAGHREYNAFIQEAINDQSLSYGFRQELKRQHASHPLIQDAGPEPFIPIHERIDT